MYMWREGVKYNEKDIRTRVEGHEGHAKAMEDMKDMRGEYPKDMKDIRAGHKVHAK